MAVVSNVPTYDSVSLVQFVSGQARIVIRIIRGLAEGPEVRGSDTVIPSLTGQVARSRVKHRRVIEGEGFISGCGADETAQLIDFVNIQDELQTLFHPVIAPQTLSVVREDGSVRTIAARVLNYVYGDDTIPTFRTISVEWESLVPDWTDVGS